MIMDNLTLITFKNILTLKKIKEQVGNYQEKVQSDRNRTGKTITNRQLNRKYQKYKQYDNVHVQNFDSET